MTVPKNRLIEFLHSCVRKTSEIRTTNPTTKKTPYKEITPTGATRGENGEVSYHLNITIVEEDDWGSAVHSISEALQNEPEGKEILSDLKKNYGANIESPFKILCARTVRATLYNKANEEMIEKMVNAFLAHLSGQPIDVTGHMKLLGLTVPAGPITIKPGIILRQPNENELKIRENLLGPQAHDMFNLFPDSILEITRKAKYPFDLQKELDAIVRAMQLVLRPSIESQKLRFDTYDPSWRFTGEIGGGQSQYMDSIKSELRPDMKYELKLIRDIADAIQENTPGQHNTDGMRVPWKAFMRYLISAQRHFDTDDRILFSIMCVEGLLGEPSIVRARFSTRVARLAEATNQNVDLTLKVFNLAYQFRHKVAHELVVSDKIRNKVRKELKSEEALLNYVRAVARSLLILQFTKHIDRSELCKALDLAMVQQDGGKAIQKRLESVPVCVWGWETKLR